MHFAPLNDAPHYRGSDKLKHHVAIITGGDSGFALAPRNAQEVVVRSLDVAAHAETVFDGRHLYQLAEHRIQKIDPGTGRVLATDPAPGDGGDSGLA